MGTITGTEILDRVSELLQDDENLRYTTADALEWINYGQRQIVTLRPDANSTIQNLLTITGTKQTLPSTVWRLLGIIRNMGVSGSQPGRPVRGPFSRSELDAAGPDWHSSSTELGTTEMVGYAYNPDTPNTYWSANYVDANINVEAEVSLRPTDLTALTEAIDIDDFYSEPLVMFVAWKFLSRESDLKEQINRAEYFKNAMLEFLGTEAQNREGQGPATNEAAA